ncbi:MAG: sulfite exporter TauE/SafE family protein [Burkholderiaceae bacterium]
MMSHVPLVLAGALSGGFVLGLTGFGNGPTALAFWLFALPPQVSAPLVAVGSVLGHLLMFGGFRHVMSARRVWPIVAGGLAGVPIGVSLLTIVPGNVFRLFGGLLLSVYALVSLAGGLRFRMPEDTPVRDGLLTPVFVRLVALSLPATLAGVWIGRRCYGRVDASLFRRIVLGMLAVSGLTLVAQSLLR